MNREFSNQAQKRYFELAEGLTTVDVNNFSELYSLLPDVDIFADNRSVIGRSLLDTLSYVDPAVSFREQDYIGFVENTNNFRMRVIPNSEIDRAVRNYKDIMRLVNDAFGHYAVSLKLMRFLIERNNAAVQRNNELLKKYSLALSTINDLQNEKLTKPMKVEAVPVKANEFLILNEEEKISQQKEEVVEEESTNFVKPIVQNTVLDIKEKPVENPLESIFEPIESPFEETKNDSSPALPKKIGRPKKNFSPEL